MANFLRTSGKKHYFTGILNSRLISWYFSKIATDLGERGVRFFKIFVEIMPIPPIIPVNEFIIRQIESVVNKILTIKKRNKYESTDKEENFVDELVYQLYDLTPKERAIIERQYGHSV